jgi:hypothetical protein
MINWMFENGDKCCQSKGSQNAFQKCQSGGYCTLSTQYTIYAPFYVSSVGEALTG